MFSWWEKVTWGADTDVLIIGAGIVGLSTALSVRERRPTARVLVLDKGNLPDGASTRNAGFACFGSLSELLEDSGRMDRNHLESLVEMRWRGLELLRRRVGDAVMGFEPCGGYELFRPSDAGVYAQCLAILPEWNAFIQRTFGLSDCYSAQDDRIPGFGFSGIEHLLWNRGEGAIHTGHTMRSLLSRCQAQGIQVLFGTPVTQIVQESRGASVITERHVFRTGSAIVTTNGFARQLLPELEVMPARAQVLVTAPIPGLPVYGTFHYDAGYYYFRHLGDRILLGGGRNLNVSGETTYQQGLTDQIQDALETLLRQVILPGHSVNIDYRWSGIMGIGPEKTPIVQRLSPDILCAVRMGGMGVAIGSLVGEQAAELESMVD